MIEEPYKSDFFILINNKSKSILDTLLGQDALSSKIILNSASKKK